MPALSSPPIPCLPKELPGVVREEESMRLRSAAPRDDADDAGSRWPGSRWPGPRWPGTILFGRSARAGADALALAVALLIATVLRHDGDLVEVDLGGVVAL